MVRWLIRLGPAAALLLALLPGCKSNEDKLMAVLLDSPLGLGFPLCANEAAAIAALGEPPAPIEEVQGGVTKIYYYVNKDSSGVLPVLNAETPQLKLTFREGQLVNVYNRSRPEDPEAKLPPFTLEPLSGLRLGALRSEFTEQLGTPETLASVDKWNFENQDGEQVFIQAQFVKPKEESPEICCGLTLGYLAEAYSLRGEEYERQKEKREKLGL